MAQEGSLCLYRDEPTEIQEGFLEAGTPGLPWTIDWSWPDGEGRTPCM